MQLNNTISYFKYRRIKTNQVQVGSLKLGGDNPIRIQSMCNVDTTNVDASVEQAIKIINAGGELVRYTARTLTDAKALKEIKQQLIDKGYSTPIVADVHFNAEIAYEVAKYVDKVRINPGNFNEKRANFKHIEYDETEYNTELEKTENSLKKLIDICNKHKTAIRIGTNHGSLSDRVMSRYGNTVEGMVESTLEFLRIFKKYNFQNVVISIKSSNVKVMIQAYREIVTKMNNEDMQFPTHLGVTEAGNELQGRIKSAAGIGALLNDGIGDTIRVSLTEKPENEIPVAKILTKYFENKSTQEVIAPKSTNIETNLFKKREIQHNGLINDDSPQVIIDLRHLNKITISTIEEIGYYLKNNEWTKTSKAADAIFVENSSINIPLPKSLKVLYNASVSNKPSENAIPILSRPEFVSTHKLMRLKNKCVFLRNEELDDEIINILSNDNFTTIILETTHPNGLADQRAFFLRLAELNLNHPVIIKKNYIDEDIDTLAIKSAADIAPLFINGYGNGIWLSNPFFTNIKSIKNIDFEILQASRVRSTSTEYIACPSCGRTNFDIENVLKTIKEKTNHLTHLKIGVMGCIVNGPGEMADADYGYVGAAKNKVSLYKNKELVKSNIPTDNALEELINLIKENNDWVEPQ